MYFEETAELKDVKNLVTQFIKSDLTSSSTGFPPSLVNKMEKLLEHITLCNQDYEYSCHHIPRWFSWIKPNASDEEMQEARILGWIFQFMTSFLLSFDDVCDKAELRFGRPSWYSQHKNSDNLLLDIQLMHSWAYLLLNKFFRHHPLYAQLLDFLSSSWYRIVKCCRMEIEFQWKNSKTGEHLNDDAINSENYNLIARHKATAVHMFLPFAWACTLAGYDRYEHAEIYDNGKEICYLLGILGQSMDDFFDSFSEHETVDERDGDIRNGQLTWLLVKAKELGTPEQWQQIKNHYGRNDTESINKVKEIYTTIGIPDIWKKNKDEKRAEIHSKANEIFKPEHEVFKRMLLFFVDYTEDVFTG